MAAAYDWSTDATGEPNASQAMVACARAWQLIRSVCLRTSACCSAQAITPAVWRCSKPRVSTTVCIWSGLPRRASTLLPLFAAHKASDEQIVGKPRAGMATSDHHHCAPPSRWDYTAAGPELLTPASLMICSASCLKSLRAT